MMQSVEFGPNKYKFSVTKSSSDYHVNMLKAYFVRPFIDSLQGVTDYLLLKIGIFVSSIPAMLAFNLFETPYNWWQGLLYLVIIDWLSGIITAVYRGDFDWNVATSKWYQCVAYTMVCGSAAVVSNTFSEIFWYFQYLVYVTFFLKEFVSILKTFKVFRLFNALRKVYVQKEPNNFFSQIEEELNKNEK